jgi:hypothetical protein
MLLSSQRRWHSVKALIFYFLFFLFFFGSSGSCGSWNNFLSSTDSSGFILPERINESSFLRNAAAYLSFSSSVSGSYSGIGIGRLNSSTATKV